MLQEYINSRQFKIEQNYKKNLATVTKPKVIQARIDALSKQLAELRKAQSLYLNESMSFRIFRASEYARIKKLKQDAEKQIPALVGELAAERNKLEIVNAKIERFKSERNSALKRLADKDCVIMELMEKDPSLCSSIGFMMQCVKHDHAYIVYDKSNSNNVYEVFLQALLASEASEETLLGQGLSKAKVAEIRAGITNALSEIQQPKAVEEGMYKIPQKYLYEEIRNAYSNGSLEGVAGAHYRYSVFNGGLTQAEGEALEKLYKNKDNYTYLHCLDALDDGYLEGCLGSREVEARLMDAVCREGVPNCAGENAPRVTGITTISNKDGDLSFLDFAEFCSMTDMVVALQCPKAEGTKEIDAILGAKEQKLVPARYVVGYFNNGRYTANPYVQSKTAKLSEATDSEEKE